MIAFPPNLFLLLFFELWHNKIVFFFNLVQCDLSTLENILFKWKILIWFGWLCFPRCELPVQLGFPLHGTVVEVRDTNGFTIQEGNGQVFLGCFLFVDLESFFFFQEKKSYMLILFFAQFFLYSVLFSGIIFNLILIITKHLVSYHIISDNNV